MKLLIYAHHQEHEIIETEKPEWNTNTIQILTHHITADNQTVCAHSKQSN